jgi:hypothetical protein
MNVAAALLIAGNENTFPTHSAANKQTSITEFAHQHKWIGPDDSISKPKNSMTFPRTMPPVAKGAMYLVDTRRSLATVKHTTRMAEETITRHAAAQEWTLAKCHKNEAESVVHRKYGDKPMSLHWCPTASGARVAAKSTAMRVWSPNPPEGTKRAVWSVWRILEYPKHGMKAIKGA